METSMYEFLSLYWPIVAGLVVVLLAGIWLVAGRRRRIDIARPSLDDAPPAPTLTRIRPDPPAMPTPALPPAPPPTIESELARLKGIGPKLIGVLAGQGITRIDQVAAWTADDVTAIDAKLGSFAGRATRDAWVEQARLLGAGDLDAYEARFGKIAQGPR